MRECSLRVVGTLPRVSHSGPAQRIAVYIDGFNLYYSLRAREWRHCYWLNIRHLAIELLLSHQELVKVRYFTSRIAVRAGHPGDEARRQRQSTYLDALQTLDDVEIHYGRHASRERSCPACEATWEEPEEKMTDVNIAVELLGDAQDGLFDTAMIVSGDTDLVGLVRAVRAIPRQGCPRHLPREALERLGQCRFGGPPSLGEGARGQSFPGPRRQRRRLRLAAPAELGVMASKRPPPIGWRALVQRYSRWGGTQVCYLAGQPVKGLLSRVVPSAPRGATRTA